MMDSREQGNTAPPPSLTEAAVGRLKAAGPWMFFLSIVSFAGCGISLLAGIIIRLAGSLPSYFGLSGPLVGCFYVVMAVVSFLPARFLFLAGSKLRSLKADDSGELLEEALRNNASFWKFCGILSIVAISLTVAIIVIAIVAVVVTA
jgi:hypothetical protein